jgi:hypothetical protein
MKRGGLINQAASFFRARNLKGFIRLTGDAGRPIRMMISSGVIVAENL